MKIKASQISDLILRTVQGLRDAQCAAAKDGITLQYLDDIEIKMEVVPDDGFNAIERTTIEKGGESKRTEIRPATKTITIESPSTVETQDMPSTSTRTQKQTGTDVVRTQREEARTTTQEQEAAAAKTVREGESTVTSQNASSNRGGDIVVQDYEVESS